MEFPKPDERIYADINGWYADPLCETWIRLDQQVWERLMNPMQAKEKDERKHAKMMDLASKHTIIRKEMFDLLNHLNHVDFEPPIIVSEEKEKEKEEKCI